MKNIRPGETSSFWQLVHHADKSTPYKDGHTVTNGKLTTSLRRQHVSNEQSPFLDVPTYAVDGH